MVLLLEGFHWKESGYRLQNRGLILCKVNGRFALKLQHSEKSWNLPCVPTKKVLLDIFFEIKLQKREAGHSLVSSAEVQNAGAIITRIRYAHVAWGLSTYCGFMKRELG